MELLAHAKTYFRFSLREQKELLISALFFGFILSFRMWGGSNFNVNTGLANWFVASIIVFMAMFVHFSAQKLFALQKGYKMHFHWWFPGILMGLLLTFIFFGVVPFFYPGSLYFEHMPGLRLGRFRYGSNVKDMAVLSIWGVVTNIFLAVIVGFLFFATKSVWVWMFIKINLIYALFSLLPIPTISGVKLSEGATAGFNIFFFSRQLYVFILLSAFFYLALVYFLIAVLGSIIPLILAMIFGGLATLIFMKIIDAKF